jgi:hypothetical protein
LKTRTLTLPWVPNLTKIRSPGPLLLLMSVQTTIPMQTSWSSWNSSISVSTCIYSKGALLWVLVGHRCLAGVRQNATRCTDVFVHHVKILNCKFKISDLIRSIYSSYQTLVENWILYFKKNCVERKSPLLDDPKSLNQATFSWSKI